MQGHDQNIFSGAISVPHFHSGPVPPPLSNSFRRHWLQAKVRDRGLGLRSRLFAFSVCYDSAAEAASMALYKIINLPFTLPLSMYNVSYYITLILNSESEANN